MVISRIIITAILGLMLIVASHTSIAEPTARIDRSVIAIDDTFTLTIRINKAGSLNAPDLGPLAKDFDVLGNSQNSRHMISNGKSESWTEWQITLMPKRKGQLTIPPLTINGEKTQPISISVQPSVPKPTGYMEPVYIESEVDQISIYVQQQVILTLRIFQSIQLDEMNISEPSFDNADMEKLGQNSFQRRVGNTPYRVHELRYAIFPQQAGEFIIPEIIFSAYETLARRSVFSMPALGKQIRKMTQQHIINVKPPEQTFNGKTWLPAKSLTLQQSWSSDLKNIRVGDSITRTITLKADGLLASQLPPFEFSGISGAKFYPDQGKADTTVSDSGVLSTRIDSAAIIPTQSGTITIPEVRFSWWNTVAQQQQEAIIPASRLTVLPALQSAQSNSTPLAIDHGQPIPSVTADTINGQPPQSILWPIVSAVLAIGWLSTLVFLWRIKTSVQTMPTTATGSSSKTETEKQLFKRLLSACNNKNNKEMRTALIDWARCYWHNDKLHNLLDIQRYCSNTELLQLIAELDRSLFSPQSADNQQLGEHILEQVKRLRTESSATPRHTEELPPLYSP